MSKEKKPTKGKQPTKIKKVVITAENTQEDEIVRSFGDVMAHLVNVPPLPKGK